MDPILVLLKEIHKNLMELKSDQGRVAQSANWHSAVQKVNAATALCEPPVPADPPIEQEPNGGLTSPDLGHRVAEPEQGGLTAPIPTYDVRVDVYNAAVAAHEANRAHCQSIGDDSQLPWDDAPEWQQVSAIGGVQSLVDNPKLTPKKMHDSWMKDKLDSGWVYGEVKDKDAKTHPCLVAYKHLSDADKAKDRIFIKTVKASLKASKAG